LGLQSGQIAKGILKGESVNSIAIQLLRKVAASLNLAVTAKTEKKYHRE
jgi:hypothetical protein